MPKQIVYTDEPMEVGRILGREILPGYGGPLSGAAVSASDPRPVTLWLPPEILKKLRRQAKQTGQTVSEFVAKKLER